MYSSIIKKTFSTSFKFYQRIAPSAKHLLMINNIKEIPESLKETKYITKESILKLLNKFNGSNLKLLYPEKINEDSILPQKTNIKPNTTTTTSVNGKINSEKSNKSVIDNTIADNQSVSNYIAQSYMGINTNFNNVIEDLNIKFDQSTSLTNDNESIKKLIDFVKRVCLVEASKLKIKEIINSKDIR